LIWVNEEHSDILGQRKRSQKFTLKDKEYTAKLIQDLWMFLMLFDLLLRNTKIYDREEDLILPNDWPKVAPVERIFGSTKSNWKLKDYRNSNFSKLNRAKKVIDALISFRTNTWFVFCSNFIKECKHTVKSFWIKYA
jgi:hypothetical protein